MRKRRNTFLRAEMSGPNGARHRDRRALIVGRIRRSLKTLAVPLLAIGVVIGGIAVPAMAASTWTAPTCAAGYVYSVQSNGQVVQAVVNTAGNQATSTTYDGWSGLNYSSVNGLGIAANGTAMYAYVRGGSSNQNITTMLQWTTGGGWVSIPNSGYSTGLNGTLVTGAVNLSTGKYMFGGYSSSNTFSLYQYDPSTNKFTSLGYFAVAENGNGDMAFDSQGNLYVVDSANSTNIYSVTAGDLANAIAAGSSSTQIPRTALAGSSSVGVSNINGMAFDADGSIYLGNASTLGRFNSTTWAQIGSNMSALGGNSTDLASCNSPATITVQKNVTARANSADQFTLNLYNGGSASGTPLGSNTTSGSATGVQPQKVVSTAVAGSTYSISESLATGSGSPSLSTYQSSYSCVVAGSSTPIASGSVSGSLTIPSTGGNVTCTFTNAPLSNQVTLIKQWGANATAGDTAGLSVGGAGVAPGSAVNATSTAGTGSNPDTANVASANAYYGGAVSLGDALTSNSGTKYAATYTCTQGATKILTNSSTGTFTMPSTQGTVACTVTNTPTAGTLQVSKVWTITNAAGATIATYHVPSQTGDTGSALPSGFAATPTVTAAGSTKNVQWGAVNTGYNVGQNLSIGETAVAVPTGCTITSQVMTNVNGQTATGTLPYATSLASTPNPNTFVITNTVKCTQTLTLVKQVAFGAASPTDWTLTGTGPTGSATGPNGVTGTAGATANVTPGVAYALAEKGSTTSTDANTALYVPTAAGWTCVDASKNTVPVTSSAVTVAYGQAVTCTIVNTTGQLTVLKHIDGSGLTANEFNLNVTPSDSSLPSHAGITGSETANTSNTFEVKPGATYTLTESSSSNTLAYLGVSLETSSDGQNWNAVTSNQITVPAGSHLYYRFVNSPVLAMMLPLTGGLGVDRLWLAGGAILALGIAGGIWQMFRMRRRRLVAQG